MHKAMWAAAGAALAGAGFLAGAAAPAPALEMRVTALERVIRISDSEIVIQSPQRLTLHAGTAINITAQQNLTAYGVGDLLLRGGNQGTLQAGSLQLAAPQVRVNNGAHPAARVGSMVQNGRVADGSTVLMIP